MRYLIFLTCILFLVPSCSSIKVSQDYDIAVSFSKYTRFTFAEKDPHRQADSLYDNELINQRFYRIIKNCLQDKGLNYQGDTEGSDFIVSFNFTVRPKMDIYNISRQMGFSYGSYNRYGGVGARTCTDISEFDQGILIIDIKDSPTQKLIWRGTGTDVISIYATPEEMNEQVKEMVTAVLRNFPPR